MSLFHVVSLSAWFEMALSVLQSGSQSSAGTTGGVTLTGVTAGSLIACSIHQGTNAVRTYTVSDGVNSFTLAVQLGGPTNGRYSGLFFLPGSLVSAGSKTIT